MLVLGWFFGLPVPFMIIWAPSWDWVIAANALLGINQGLAWSMTVIMKVDLAGPKSRGLAIGLNEFAGYLAVGVTAFLTGYLASRYGLRPTPIYLGIGYAVWGHCCRVFSSVTHADRFSLKPLPIHSNLFRSAFARSSHSPRSATATCLPLHRPASSITSTTA